MRRTAKDKSADKRPEPRPRKRPELWMASQLWDALEEVKKQYDLRRSSVERGKSKLDYGALDEIFALPNQATFYETLRVLVSPERAAERRVSLRTVLTKMGAACGDVWEWATSIKGLGGQTPGGGRVVASILAEIDDIERFATPSKLRRFAGYGVINGEIDRPRSGEKLPFNRRLKTQVYLAVDSMIKAGAFPYSDMYAEFQDSDRRKHPHAVCTECGARAALISKESGRGETFKKAVYKCPEDKGHKTFNYTPTHIRFRARRKAASVFLSHLWLVWRESEGLSTVRTYAEAILGHENIVPPPNWPLGDN